MIIDNGMFADNIEPMRMNLDQIPRERLELLYIQCINNGDTSLGFVIKKKLQELDNTPPISA